MKKQSEFRHRVTGLTASLAFTDTQEHAGFKYLLDPILDGVRRSMREQ